MESIYTVVLAFIIIFLAVLGMSVKLLFTKKGRFSGGSCKITPGLSEKGISSCAGCDDSIGCDKKPDYFMPKT